MLSDIEILGTVPIFPDLGNDVLKELRSKMTKRSYKKNNIIFSDEINVLYNDLKKINEQLWEIEDKIRLCEKNSDFKDKFIQLARDVYFTNDKRSKTKSKINKILGSNIKEVKQYTEY